MGKKKKSARREQREQRKQQKAAAAQVAQATQGRNKFLALLCLALTAGGALALLNSDLPRVWLGVLLFLGLGGALVFGISGLGGGVKPNDRGKSGNIDFGR